VHQYIVDMTGELAVNVLKDEYSVTQSDYVEVAELIVGRVDAYSGDWPAESTRLLELVAELAVCCLVDERTCGQAEQPGLPHVLSASVIEAGLLPMAHKPTLQQHDRQQTARAIITHASRMLKSYDAKRLLERS